MAFIDTAHLDRKPTSPVAFEALMAQLDTRRLELALQKPPAGSAPTHVHFVQQMLLAAMVAAGLIVAVAGVMMLKCL